MKNYEQPMPGWTPVRTKIPVHIPDLSGEGVKEIIEVEVDAWKGLDGEIYLTGEAEDALDEVKARHIGLLTPEEIRGLRQCLQLTQKEITFLLQLGEKTWTRWENGRERPSRSLNLLLHGLMDGRINVAYLRQLHPDIRPRQQTRFRSMRESATATRQFSTYHLPTLSTTIPEDESASIPA